jgi:hypothetical protein
MAAAIAQTSNGDWSHLVSAIVLLTTSLLIHACGSVYPWLSGIAAFFAFILAGHSVLRLVYRWLHCINTLLMITQITKN